MSSTIVSINDTEIERGRGKASDSSSSRESSPLNTRKQGPTSVSDDDDVGDTVPATALATALDDNETPPPPGRPLVREPVAFSSVADRTNIPTYQASLPGSLISQKRYLPGQNPSTANAKKKRMKRNLPFSAQTGRFRLQTYAHDTNTQNNDQLSQQEQSPCPSSDRTHNNATPAPTDSGTCPAPSSSIPQNSPSEPPNKRTKLTSDQAAVELTSNAFDIPIPQPVLYSGQQGPDKHRFEFVGNYSQSRISSTLSSAQTSNITQPTKEIRHQYVDTSGSGSSMNRSGFYNRMITILIHDMRSGKMDRQLAEVFVPVRLADDPRDGFWADAKDIVPKLQSSPARVDGPAKMYTMRGKYRQFFLRVSADNTDFYTSANIRVGADRTVDVVVETPLEIGVLPSSPRIPSELLPFDPEVVDTSDLSDGSFTWKNDRKGTGGQGQRKRSSRKRQYSSSGDGSSDQGFNKNPRFKRTLQKKTKGSRSGTVAMSVLDHLPSLKDRSDSMGVRSCLQKSFEQIRGYESPTTDEDPSRLYDIMVRAVETVIQRQPDWPAYFNWRNGRLSDLIKACGFTQRMMDELIGELAPFRTKSHEISMAHVLAALRIEQKMASEATEILKLLRLYGEDGTRCSDSRVIEMITRDDPNMPYKQLKQLLCLLRNIHEEWERDPSGIQSDNVN